MTKSAALSTQSFSFTDDLANIFPVAAFVDAEGNPWFIAKDVCDALDIGNVTNAVRTLVDGENLTFTVLRAGQSRSMNCVNLSGLLKLIFQSRPGVSER